MDSIAILLSKKFSSRVLFRDGTDGYLYKRAVAARALLVYVACKGSLADACLTTDQNPAVVQRNFTRLLTQLLHGWRPAYRLYNQLRMFAQINVLTL